MRSNDPETMLKALEGVKQEKPEPKAPIKEEKSMNSTRDAVMSAMEMEETPKEETSETSFELNGQEFSDPTQFVDAILADPQLSALLKERMG